MAELEIRIRLDREDDVFDVEVDACNVDGEDMQSDLAFDKQFQNLLQALISRFVELAEVPSEEEL